MGEGAGALFLNLLSLPSTWCQDLGEVVGYGLSGDAHHITAPADDDGAFRAMRSALRHAALKQVTSIISTPMVPRLPGGMILS